MAQVTATPRKHFTAFATGMALFAAGIIACGSRGEQTAGGEASGAYGGTVIVATGADAAHLFPPLVTRSQGRAITESIFDFLADVGDSLNVLGDEGFVPRLASEWRWGPDSLSIAFAIRPDAKWHDGKPVRASDVQFTYQLYTDDALSSPLASLLSNIDSVTTPDSLTAVVWLKHYSPLAFFDVAAQMLILPEHVYGTVPPDSLRTSELIRQPVGSGRFRFRRWVPQQTIEIVADTANYRGRPHLDRVIWSIAPDYTAASTQLFTGQADVYEAMSQEYVAKAKSSETVRVAMKPGFDLGVMIFNTRTPKSSPPHPLFADRALRRALTMAIDREGIIQNVFDSLAAPSIGPMLRAMPTTDTSIAQIPFDVTAAQRLLDSLGWKDDGSGVRKKDGRELAFTVLSPTSSKNRERCAVLIQNQLKRVGVRVTIRSLEASTFHRLAAERDFDAIMQTWHLDASPATLRQIWSVEMANEPESNNFGAYANPQFDAQLDSALHASSLRESRPLFQRAYRTIIDDAPAVWLYELKTVIGYHRRIHLAPFLRADAWWAHLADWSIAPDERIARDQIPLLQQ